MKALLSLLTFIPGYRTRMMYKKMKALITMVQLYRLKKMRTYINALHQKFANAKQMRDYGKSILWPAPPPSLSKTTQILRKIFKRWHASMVLSKIPKKEWPEMKIKISAASALMHKRPLWGIHRKWEGNYLANHGENVNYTSFNEAVNNLRNSRHFNTVLFSSFVTKFNKFNKLSERVLLVTDLYIFKLESQKFRNMKEVVSMKDLSRISVSPGQDQLIVLHYPGGNDMVISLHSTKQEDRIGELVGLLCERHFQLHKADLPVQVSNSIECMLGGKKRIINVTVTSDVQIPTFVKDGNNVLYKLPTNYAILENGNSHLKNPSS